MKTIIGGFIAAILLLFIFRTMDKIVVTGKGWMADAWKRHIRDEFPNDAICFNCNEADCVGCLELQKEILKSQRR